MISYAQFITLYPTPVPAYFFWFFTLYIHECRLESESSILFIPTVVTWDNVSKPVFVTLAGLKKKKKLTKKRKKREKKPRPATYRLLRAEVAQIIVDDQIAVHYVEWQLPALKRQTLFGNQICSESIKRTHGGFHSVNVKILLRLLFLLVVSDLDTPS